MPCIRDIALSGRNALSVLIVLNAWIPPAPNSDAVKLINETFFERRKQERESGGKKELKEVSIHIHRVARREKRSLFSDFSSSRKMCCLEV